MLIHRDQRQCQQVYGEQSTSPYLSMSFPGATDPRLGGADTSTHYALASCCQREDLQSITKPWWAIYPSHPSLGSCRDPQPQQHRACHPPSWGEAWGQASCGAPQCGASPNRKGPAPLCHLLQSQCPAYSPGKLACYPCKTPGSEKCKIKNIEKYKSDEQIFFSIANLTSSSKAFKEHHSCCQWQEKVTRTSIVGEKDFLSDDG